MVVHSCVAIEIHRPSLEAAEQVSFSNDLVSDPDMKALICLGRFDDITGSTQKGLAVYRISKFVGISPFDYSAVHTWYIVGVSSVDLKPYFASDRLRPANFVVVPSLPSGLNLNPTTGVIHGTPTQARSTSEYTITGRNVLSTESVIIKFGVLCPGGHYAEMGECRECPQGTYNYPDLLSFNACVLCNKHMNTLEEGASTKFSCVCVKGYQKKSANDDECEMCPEGK